MITSLVNSINPVVDASRDDLQPGNVVTVTYNGVGATSYLWTLSYIPVDASGTPSTATLAAPTLSSTTFTVDLPGSYLVKLVIDAALMTEAEEYVRLRYIPNSGLRLVAAGERNDLLGTIPVDASPSGWSNDLNRSLLILSESMLVRPSGNVFIVDPVPGVGNYTIIQDAITAAGTTPYLILVNPGVYSEGLIIPALAKLTIKGLNGLGEYASANEDLYPTEIIGFHDIQGTSICFDSVKLSSPVGSPAVELDDSSLNIQFKNCIFQYRSLGAILGTNAGVLDITDCTFFPLASFGPPFAADIITIDAVANARICRTTFKGSISTAIVSNDVSSFIRIEFCTVSNALGEPFKVFSGDFLRLEVMNCNINDTSSGGTPYFDLFPVTTPGNGNAYFSNSNIGHIIATNMTGDLVLQSCYIYQLTVPSAATVFYRGTTVLNESLINPAAIQTVASQMSLSGSGSETVLSAITRLLGQQNSTTTSDATPALIDSLVLLPSAPAKWLQITVTATEATTSEYGVWVFSLMIYSDLTNMYIGPAGIQNDFTDAPGAWSVSIAPNLLDLEITVTGEVGKSIDWVSVMKVVP